MIGAGGRELLIVNHVDCKVAGSYFIPVPEACEVRKIRASIGLTIVGNLAIAFKIGGTAITGSAISFTATGSDPGDVEVATPTALNRIAAGGTLEVALDGVPTTGGPVTIVIEIVKGPLGPKTA
jgi:hypothetical protein